MAWGVDRGQDPARVWLRFSARVATEIRETVWHRTQRVADLPDRRGRPALVIDGLDEILGWVLGFGDQVEVLAPARTAAPGLRRWRPRSPAGTVPDAAVTAVDGR